MARLLRLEYEGAIYHVTVRGNDRQNIFLDDKDRKYLLSRLSACVEECGVRLYVFCLMSNHFHLVIETPRGNLSRFMQKVLTGFTVYFNCRHHRSGHVTQGRYNARLVEGDDYLKNLSRYIHLNPVKTKRMANKPKAEKVRYLRDYTWSSYRGYIGECKEFPFVDYAPMLSLMAGRGKKQQQRACRSFVQAMVATEDEEFIQDLRMSPRGIGSDKFRGWVDGCFAELIGQKEKKEDVSFRKIEGTGLPPDKVLESVAKEFHMTVAQLSRRRRNSVCRGVAGIMLCQYADYTQRQVAEVLGLTTGAAVSYQIARAEAKSREDKKLARAVSRIRKTLDDKRKKK
jgi:putative transposase